MKVLVTGGNGFVGKHLLSNLEGLNNYQTFTYGRKKSHLNFEHHFGDFSQHDDFSLALKGIDVVIHCAGRSHVMKDSSTDPLADYRLVNKDFVIRLTRAAAFHGVKRFIFISSIKVNGEFTLSGVPFNISSPYSASDFYGLSKAEAEVELRTLSSLVGIEFVIIRPCLIYGPSVKANFASLMNLVSKGVPLPFGCITQNKRSLVSVTNLVDLIITCIDHPKAVNQVFLASDDHDISTSEMVREMAKALGKSSCQLPVPVWCYKLAGKLFNKSDVVDRLTGSLQVDISHTKDTLGWKPPQTLQEGFKQTAQAFLQAKTK
ncbi:MAG: SDR family oxidoreductase [Shewanella sp.]|uniref:UDP-glucose 4-epimerase family protein n=1 Tax=Shewanella sp. TaxID=50422 RepID=UPI0026493BEF|nr:SDR family oxidoreductase [Shewanella sp.]MDN5501812.1 SDR family oxidoreductase [Shewanella sp.]MDN5529709.1 SDR family oxidoreductase [Shewanella sp.]